MSFFSVEGLSVRYGPIKAVTDVSLRVEQGEIVALLGPNGAGKSSILNACVGLVPKSEGRVGFAEKVISADATESIVRAGLTLVPEGRRVFPDLTTAENLKLGSACSRQARQDVQRHMAEVFELFPRLLERKSQIAGTLSGGEQQMLAIGRALMSGPKMLLLDEPSLGLAPNIVDQIFDLLVDLRKRGLTLLVVEQNVELALDISDRAYVLANGRIASAGTPPELRAAGNIAASYLGHRSA
jgi:branched-chain amino acid transport system ATP-binding protein